MAFFKNLIFLDLSGNEVGAMNFSDFHNLEHLNVGGTYLVNADLSTLINLKFLDIAAKSKIG